MGLLDDMVVNPCWDVGPTAPKGVELRSLTLHPHVFFGLMYVYIYIFKYINK